MTPILWKIIAIHLPFLSRYFCKSITSFWQKVVYTPPICITMRLPFVSRDFCRSIRVRGRWNTPKVCHNKTDRRWISMVTSLPRLALSNSSTVTCMPTKVVYSGRPFPCPFLGKHREKCGAPTRAFSIPTSSSRPQLTLVTIASRLLLPELQNGTHLE